MKTEDIKKILLPLIPSTLLAQAQAEGISDNAIFNHQLFVAMTKQIPELLIQSSWQLSALGSGLKNYKAAIDWE